MFASAKEILTKAKEGKYAVGAFNVSNMEIAQAVVMAGVERRSPLILQITESAMKYAGDKELSKIVRTIIDERSEDIPVGINLDHGKTFDAVKKAIDLGFSSVMIDGSRLTFQENKNLTKMVVEYSHQRNIPVQAELGIVPYLGELSTDQVDWSALMTDPDKAKEFIEYTKADFLAVAIGNAHGFFREAEVFDWARLKTINEKLGIPLVLHGASDCSVDKISKSIENGVACFNVDTDIRLAFMGQLTKMVDSKISITDPRKIMEAVREAVKKKVIEKINIFGSGHKA